MNSFQCDLPEVNGGNHPQHMTVWTKGGKVMVQAERCGGSLGWGTRGCGYH